MTALDDRNEALAHRADAHSALVALGMPATCARRLDREPHTLDEIATVLSLTRERVRQIEAEALTRAEGALRERGVRVVDDLLPGVAWCGAHEVMP